MTKRGNTPVCGNAARDPSTGKPHKGPHAKTCERKRGHGGPHRIGPHGELGNVIEWTDDAAGWVAFNQRAQTKNTNESGARAAGKATDMSKPKNTTPTSITKVDPKSDPRCASKQQSHRCDLPVAHEGAHLARVPGATGFTIKTWNASANDSWRCCSAKTNTKVKVPCWRPEDHAGGHRALVARTNGATDLALWKGDSATKMSTVKLHDAAAQLRAAELDRAGRPAPDARSEKPKAARENFDAVWKRLEADGKCDAAGGMQYERIRALWTKIGGDIAEMIQREANKGPHDEQHPADTFYEEHFPKGAEESRPRPMTLDDEPEDPEGDAIAMDAMREHEEKQRRAYDEAREALDLDARELAELREMEHKAEEQLDGELDIADLRAVLERFRDVLRTRPGRSGEDGKRVASSAPSKSADIETGRSSGLVHPPVKLFGCRRHAAGALWSFADLQGEDFDKVVANLKERDVEAREAGVGDDQALISAVVLVEVENEQGRLEKFVLDGWNRLRCCEAAGVRPRFVMYAGGTDIDTLIKYTDAANDKRRQMTSSQRAAFAAEANVLRLKQGNSAARADGSAKTQVQRAKDLGTTDRQIRRAETVKEQVAPKVWEAVKAGKVPLDAAKEAIGISEAKQTELAERALAGDKEMKAGKFRALARQEKKREAVAHVNNGKVPPMPMGPFGLIVVDYSWKYRNSDGHEGSRGHMPYPPMEWEEILAHAPEGAKRAADDCVLGLWVPNAYLLRIGEVLAKWEGFVDMEAPITWDKVHIGMGIRGPRHQTEHLILAERGKPMHTLNEISTLYREPRVVGAGGHSKKPDGLYDLLAKHCAGPRLELFAIGPRDGWECWGAEADKPIATPRKKSKILTAADERVAAGGAG